MASHNRPQSSFEGEMDLRDPSQPQPSPTRYHRDQASLEGIINLAGPEPLAADERAHAERRFYSIVEHFENNITPKAGYNRPLLIKCTFEYSRSELSKDTFLHAFFQFVELDIADRSEIDFNSQLQENLITFADFLLDFFYLPLKAAAKRAPQPTPAHLSVIQRVQGGQHEFTATLDRLSYLRGSCLLRDHHRCVVSRKFDYEEALRRVKTHDADARDDEGGLLKHQSVAHLEVAHILPHSLTQANANSELDDSKKTALAVLNMFDCDVRYLIDGADIDRPFNAITLTHGLHQAFGSFDVYFEPDDGQEHTYIIKSFLPSLFTADYGLPLTRTFFISEDRQIDAPSPRLLALHRAIAHILHLSGAGDYIDKMLRDFETTGVQEDGTTELGRIVQLRYGGWLDDAVDVY